MKTLTARVTSKGQLTLPKALRNSLGIHEGDQIEFAISSPVEASLRKIGGAGTTAGLLRHLAKERSVSLREMNEAIRNRMRRKHGGGR